MSAGFLYEEMLGDDVLNLILEATNNYGKSNKNKLKLLDNFIEVNREELLLFFGILLYMGIVKLPSMRDYWSNDIIFGNHPMRNYMLRDRFEIILASLHYSLDSEIFYKNKLDDMISLLNNQYQKFRKPSKNLVIDESLVLWKGRLSFKVYIPNKRNKF